MCLTGLIRCCLPTPLFQRKKTDRSTVVPSIHTMGNVTNITLGPEGGQTLVNGQWTRPMRRNSVPDSQQKAISVSTTKRLFFHLMLKRKRSERIQPEAIQRYKEVAGVPVLDLQLREQIPRTPPVRAPTIKRINTD